MESVDKPPLHQQTIVTLKIRAEFLAAAASGRKWVAPGLILQVKPHSLNEDGAKANVALPPLRYGLTASKKVGNAVKRNRARRRLRALAQAVLVKHAAPNHDYVLIAKVSTITRPYDDLEKDLINALKKMKVWRE